MATRGPGNPVPRPPTRPIHTATGAGGGDGAASTSRHAFETQDFDAYLPPATTALSMGSGGDGGGGRRVGNGTAGPPAIPHPGGTAGARDTMDSAAGDSSTAPQQVVTRPSTAGVPATNDQRPGFGGRAAAVATRRPVARPVAPVPAPAATATAAAASTTDVAGRGDGRRRGGSGGEEVVGEGGLSGGFHRHHHPRGHDDADEDMIGSGSVGGGVNRTSSQPATPARVALRPVAITKWGPRQFVETSHGIRLHLQNCVCTTNLQASLDLAHITAHVRNAEYNPKRFSGVILKLREPSATALLFRTGKVCITGVKNEDDGKLTARKIAKLMLALGYTVAFTGIQVQNLVVTGDVGFPVRLEAIARDHAKASSYEPELFSGLIFRMEDVRVVALIFVTGKLVLTGAKSRSALLAAMEVVYPIIHAARKRPSAAAGVATAGGSGGGASSGTSSGWLYGVGSAPSHPAPHPTTLPPPPPGSVISTAAASMRRSVVAGSSSVISGVGGRRGGGGMEDASTLAPMVSKAGGAPTVRSAASRGGAGASLQPIPEGRPMASSRPARRHGHGVQDDLDY